MACVDYLNVREQIDLGTYPCDIAQIPTGCVASMDGLYSISAQNRGLIAEDMLLKTGDPIVLTNQYNENSQVIFTITQPNGEICKNASGQEIEYSFELAYINDITPTIDWDCECNDGLTLDDC